MALSALIAAAKEPVAAKQPVANAVVATSAKAEAKPDGAELFAREWLPNDSRAHGGDGLGPVFNDSSCVACHNQGGTGGAGPASKNVDIITAFTIPMGDQGQPQTLPQGLFNLAFGAIAPPVPVQLKANGKVAVAHAPTAQEKKLAKQREREQLMKLHPGFASSRSVVLHHFGIDPKYQQWRSGVLTGQGFQGNVTFTTMDSVTVAPEAVQTATPATTDPRPPALSKDAPTVEPTSPGADVDADLAPQAAVTSTAITFSQMTNNQLESNPEVNALQNEVRMNHSGILNSTTQNGNIQISHSQRNPIALFGIGVIDAIPEKAIVDLAKLEHEKYPAVAGRAAKQKDGKIGRFGWKAQKPSLEDFTLTACAVELGLNVPGHEQAGVPLKPNYKAPGLDMNQAECDAMVSYLRNLPAPTERKPATAQEAGIVSAGHQLFATVGCAQCHVEKVGAASGIYSDLLLHDMGPELGDSGNYGVFTPDAPEEEQDDSGQVAASFSPFGGLQPAEVKMTAQQMAKLVGALRQEWRTAPLWGVRDSGPYLHDGRADTLEQAIAFHGGHGATAAVKFFELKPAERQQVIAFLKSLTAPEPVPATAKLAAQ
jgi:CxxC motif-containing protein (DUF1111 family)